MEVYEHLGLVNGTLGERRRALDAYRHALQAGDTAMSETARQRINVAIERSAQQDDNRSAT